MNNYTVSRKEVWTSYVAIYADSEQEAIEKVSKGEGRQIDLDYSHDLGTDLWDAIIEPKE